MEYYLDINTRPRCENNPVYGSFIVKRNMANSIDLHRLRGMYPAIDDEQEELRFDLDGNLSIYEDRLENSMLTFTEVKVYSQARTFGFAIPRNFLIPEAATFNDIALDACGKPDSMAYHVLGYFQILMHLFSSENIHLTWNGDLKGETIPEVTDVNGTGFGECADDDEGMNDENDDMNVVIRNVHYNDDDSQTRMSDMGRPIDIMTQNSDSNMPPDMDEDTPRPKKRGRPRKNPTPPKEAKTPAVRKVKKFAIDGEPTPMCPFVDFKNSKRDPRETVFHVTTAEGSFAFPRVMVDLIHVPKTEMNLIDGSYCTNDNIMYDSEEAYFVVFTIVDPTINVNRGIRRLIEKNIIDNMKKEESELKFKKKAVPDINEMRMEDSHSGSNNLSCINQAKDVIRAEQIIEKMSFASTLFDLLDQFVEDPFKFKWDQVGSRYDPCILFRLFDHPEHSEFPFLWMRQDESLGVYSYTKLSRRNPDSESKISDEEFLTHRQIAFHPQRYVVPFNIDGTRENLNYSLTCYSVPNRVFRYSQHHINAYLPMNTYIPFYTYSEKQTNIPVFAENYVRNANTMFPVITAMTATTAKRNNEELFVQLSNGINAFKNSTMYSCEQTRADLFGIIDTLPSIESSSTYPNTPMKKLRDQAFDAQKRSLHGRSKCIPAPIAAIMRWIEKSTKSAENQEFSLFVDFYGKGEDGMGFKRYENMTCHSNFFANLSDLIFDETEALWYAHSATLKHLLMGRTQYALNFGFQMSALTLGKHERGKSFVLKHLANYLIPGTYLRVESESMYAANSDTSEAAMIIMRDDIDKNSPMYAFKGQESNAKGMWKSSRTSGRINRAVLTFLSSKRRVTMTVTSDKRSVEMSAGNVDNVDISPANVSRLEFEVSVPSNRLLGISELEAKRDARGTAEINRRRDNYRRFVQGCQAFVAIGLYLIRGGAIYYNHHTVRAMGTRMADRFFTIYTAIVGGLFPTEFVRFQNERLPILVEACMMQRVYVMISSGALSCIDILPSTPFSLEIYRKLSKINMFMTTDEDFIMAISFYESLFKKEEMRVFVQYIVDVLSFRSGYFPGQDPSTVRDTSFYSVDGPTFTSPKIVDYNRINLSNVFTFCTNEKSEEEDLKVIASILNKKYPHVHLNDLVKFLMTLNTHPFACPKWTPTMGVNAGAHACRTSREPDAPFAMDIFNVLERIAVKLPNSQKPQFIWTINRGWLDRAAVPDYGILKATSCCTDERFNGSIFEMALRLLKYEGMTKREILLPGMTYTSVKLSHRDSSRVKEMPHVFKTILYDGYRFTQNEMNLFNSLQVPTGILIYTVPSDDADQQPRLLPYRRSLAADEFQVGDDPTVLSTHVSTDLSTDFYERLTVERILREGVHVPAGDSGRYTTDKETCEDALHNWLGAGEGQANVADKFSPAGLELLFDEVHRERFPEEEQIDYFTYLSKKDEKQNVVPAGNTRYITASHRYRNPKKT